jgi:hypothetical protein
MRLIDRDWDVVLDVNDLDDLRVVGFSVYNNVLILWDEDFDPRVQEAIDLFRMRGGMLIAIHEHKGSVVCFWESENNIPDEYMTEIELDDDIWDCEHRTGENK